MLQGGSVYIVDRKKELIKVKGLQVGGELLCRPQVVMCPAQVAPAELENLLRGLPGVADVAVIGVPHERSGEVPRAYVVRADAELREEDVTRRVAEQLARHKQLAGGVEFVTAIPKSAAGKILRKDLKAAYLSGL